MDKILTGKEIDAHKGENIVVVWSQFALFSLVGFVNTAIHYSIFILLLTLKVNYMVSSVCGYLIGTLNSYVMNRKISFKVKTSMHLAELSKFIFVNALSLGINLAAIWIIVSFTSIKPQIAQLPAIFFSMIANFLGNKIWTFRKPSSDTT